MLLDNFKRFLYRKSYTIRRPDQDEIFTGYTVCKMLGWSIGFHVFKGADAEGCFHSHPATAYRFIIWGGYVEEVAHVVKYGDFCARCCEYVMDEENGPPRCQCGLFVIDEVSHYSYRTWYPGQFGRIDPEFEHRIARLLFKRSISIWVRGPITNAIETRGC